jgi:hypothetical protein
MHILVSFCNLKARGCPALGLLDTATLEFQVVALVDEVARTSGLTGLAISDDYVFAVAQSLADSDENPGSASALLVLDRKNLALRHRHEFRAAADVHSIWLDGSRLLAVSTGTDEVIEVVLQGPQVVSERVVWRPEEGGSREDSHHLNAICGRDGGVLVTAFGTKTATTSNTARDGFVVDITTGERVASGIDQPHSLALIGTGMACCESRKAAVRILDAKGTDRISARLPGYTRGLCVAGEKLYVATSVGRRHSRSTGAINNCSEDGPPGGRCTVSRLSLATLEVEQTTDIGACAQEIYDLIPVEGTRGWPIAPEVRWRDTAIRELAGVVDQRTTWAKQTTADLTRREAELSAAQEQLDASAKAVVGMTASLRRAEGELGFFREIAREAIDALDPERAQPLRYRQLVMRLRTTVEDAVPAGAIMAVVSKGDDELLRLAGREGWHFPQTEAGEYAGCYPASGTAAVAHLEAITARGADYLVIPDSSLWWLDHYPELAAHLRGYREVARQEGAGRIIALCEPLTRDDTLDNVVARCADCSSDAPAVLDWNSGLDLTRIAARCAVFSPSQAGPVLPYLERSIDIVAIPPDPSLDGEARRVAKTAVLTAIAPNGGSGTRRSFRVDWQTGGPASSSPAVTLVVACPASIPVVGRLWDGLIGNLPEGFAGEIITDADTASVDAALARRAAGRSPQLVHLSRSTGESDSSFFNRAAEGRVGDVLAFITPSLLPLNGWLAPLCDLLRKDARIGVVAGKVFAPDGRLDEAGVAVFSDGSSLSFGGGDYQVDDPLYDYVREADCCSGYLLATGRALFDDLGGFDRRIRTAVYAFADYCFRTRGRGLRTYYQPESRFVLTQRLGPADGAALDRESFRSKWGPELESMPCPQPIWDRGTWHSLAVS